MKENVSGCFFLNTVYIIIIIIIIIKRKLKAQINRKNVTNAPRWCSYRKL